MSSSTHDVNVVVSKFRNNIYYNPNDEENNEAEENMTCDNNTKNDNEKLVQQHQQYAAQNHYIQDYNSNHSHSSSPNLITNIDQRQVINTATGLTLSPEYIGLGHGDNIINHNIVNTINLPRQFSFDPNYASNFNLDYGAVKQSCTISATTKKRQCSDIAQGDRNDQTTEIAGDAKRSKTTNRTAENQANNTTNNTTPTQIAAKPDVIHVRARRGQATDSHSLAERVRREKISQRMKYLQDLVPGCNKVTGKAVMLDEIINYVQSLQQQVEFLSMKLAAVPLPVPTNNIDLSLENLLKKEICHSEILLNEDPIVSYLTKDNDCTYLPSQDNLLFNYSNKSDMYHSLRGKYNNHIPSNPHVIEPTPKTIESWNIHDFQRGTLETNCIQNPIIQGSIFYSVIKKEQ